MKGLYSEIQGWEGEGGQEKRAIKIVAGCPHAERPVSVTSATSSRAT